MHFVVVLWWAINCLVNQTMISNNFEFLEAFQPFKLCISLICYILNCSELSIESFWVKQVQNNVNPDRLTENAEICGKQNRISFNINTEILEMKIILTFAVSQKMFWLIKFGSDRIIQMYKIYFCNESETRAGNIYWWLVKTFNCHYHPNMTLVFLVGWIWLFKRLIIGILQPSTYIFMCG